jgi:biopolymer transport protein TolR
MSQVRNRKLMGDINVVPYIDVMLVLLIIFMVTAPLLEEGVTVDLPDAPAAPIDPNDMENESIILSIDSDGALYLNLGDAPDQPKNRDAILQMVSAALGRNPETPVYVKGDGSAFYQHIMTGAVLMQQAGATQLSFLADPAELELE